MYVFQFLTKTRVNKVTSLLQVKSFEKQQQEKLYSYSTWNGNKCLSRHQNILAITFQNCAKSHSCHKARLALNSHSKTRRTRYNNIKH